MGDCRDYPPPDLYSRQRQPSPTTVWLSGRPPNREDSFEHLPVQRECVAASVCEPVHRRTVAVASPCAGLPNSPPEEDPTRTTAARSSLYHGRIRCTSPDDCIHSRHRSTGCAFYSTQGEINPPQEEAASARSPPRSYSREQGQEQNLTNKCRRYSAGGVPAGTPAVDKSGEGDFISSFATMSDRNHQSRHSTGLVHGAEQPWPQQPSYSARNFSSSNGRRSAYVRCLGLCNMNKCFVPGNDDRTFVSDENTGCPGYTSGSSSPPSLPRRRPGFPSHHPLCPMQDGDAAFAPRCIDPQTCRSRTGTAAGTAVSAAAAAAAAAARAQSAADAAVEAHKEAEALADRAHLEEEVSADAPPGAGATAKMIMYEQAWHPESVPCRASLVPGSVTHVSRCSQQVKPRMHPAAAEQTNFVRNSACSSSNSSSIDNSSFSQLEPVSLRHLAQASGFSPPGVTSYTARRTDGSDCLSSMTGTTPRPMGASTPPAAAHTGGMAARGVTAGEQGPLWVPWKPDGRASFQKTSTSPRASVPVTSLDPWTSPPTPTNLFSSPPPLTGATPWGWDEALTAAAAASSPSSCPSTSIAVSASTRDTPLWRHMQQNSLARRVAAAETAAIERQRRASTGKKPAWTSLLAAARDDNGMRASCPVNRRSRLLSAVQLQQQRSSCCSQPLSSLAIASLHAQQKNTCRGSCNSACRAVATAAERVLQRRRREGGMPFPVVEGSRSRKSKDGANRSPISTAAAAVAQAVSAAAAPVQSALDTAELFEALGLDADGRPKDGFAPLPAEREETEASAASVKGEKEKSRSSYPMTSAQFQKLTRSGGGASSSSISNKNNTTFSRTCSSSDSVSSNASYCPPPPGKLGHRCVATSGVQSCLPNPGPSYGPASGRSGRRCGSGDIFYPGEEHLQYWDRRPTGASRRSQSACTTRGINKASPVAAAAAAAAAVLAAANALVESASSAAAAAADSVPPDRNKRQSYSSVRHTKSQSEGEVKNSAAAAAVASLRAAKKAAATASAALDTLQQQAEEEAEGGGVLQQQDLLCEGCFSWMDDDDSYCAGMFEEHCCAAAAAQSVQERASAALAAVKGLPASNQEWKKGDEDIDVGKKQEKRKKSHASGRKSELIAPDIPGATEDEGSESTVNAKKKEKKQKPRKSDASTVKNESESEDANSRRSERRKQSKRSTAAEESAPASKEQQKPRHSKAKKAAKGDDDASLTLQSRASSLKNSSSSQGEKRTQKHASIALEDDTGGSTKQFCEADISASATEAAASSLEIKKSEDKTEQKENVEPRPKDSGKKRGSQKEKKKKRQSSASDFGEVDDHLEAESSNTTAGEEPTVRTPAKAEEAAAEDVGTSETAAAKKTVELVHGETSDFPDEEGDGDSSAKPRKRKESRHKKLSRASSLATSVDEEEDQGSGEEGSPKGKTLKKKHSSSASRERKSSKKKDRSSSKSSSRKNTAALEDGEGGSGEEKDGDTAETDVKKGKKEKKSVAADEELDKKSEMGEGMEDSQVSNPKQEHMKQSHHSNRASNSADDIIDVQKAGNDNITSKGDVVVSIPSCSQERVNSSLTDADKQSNNVHLAGVSPITQDFAVAVGTYGAVAALPNKPGVDGDLNAADLAVADTVPSLERMSRAGGEESTCRDRTVEPGSPNGDSPGCSAANATSAIPGIDAPQRNQQTHSSPMGAPLLSTLSPQQLAPEQQEKTPDDKAQQQQTGPAVDLAQSGEEQTTLREGGETSAVLDFDLKEEQSKEVDRHNDKTAQPEEQMEGPPLQHGEEIEAKRQPERSLENQVAQQTLSHQHISSDRDAEVQEEKVEQQQKDSNTEQD